ncbi:glycosyltransferase family 69 protein [Laccaria amethystina LaAM-08-1]|uniref:Glycosyltransferase family 69 protein n=1 Tax=Laccaria amethystina LaAM-08-1 TaxID=1095629 RepID=A0A0C9WQE2_9AGAR|nr:glycosyltransferase family 69 protein [Laccaria amethystina LaAM-08-1]KIJ93370.1 glycosyltransferase family 69 protein [Laccaria amethystina LaAM-08-1]
MALRAFWVGLGCGEDRRDVLPSKHKYYFAINRYNSFDVIPDLFSTLFRTAAILRYRNIFVSIYESGSSDQTKALLGIFDALTRSVGLRVTTRTRGALTTASRPCRSPQFGFRAPTRAAGFGGRVLY